MEFEMDHDDRSAVLAAMYQDDDDPAAADQPINTNRARTRKIRVGIIEYEVPTVEYTQQLETMIQHHARVIERQQRLIDRMAAMLNKSRSGQQGHLRQLDDLRLELSKKIGRRETP
jgi:hypothetical protein